MLLVNDIQLIFEIFVLSGLVTLQYLFSKITINELRSFTCAIMRAVLQHILLILGSVPGFWSIKPGFPNLFFTSSILGFYVFMPPDTILHCYDKKYKDRLVELNE